MEKEIQKEKQEEITITKPHCPNCNGSVNVMMYYNHEENSIRLMCSRCKKVHELNLLDYNFK
jgi:ribosomal protein S27AE|tara:strand:- start:306 stop:491 length:186 start_codon:yes stop_codon:yes gene_type:complete